MSYLRIIECDVCGEQMKEDQTHAGWQYWGELRGVTMNGIDNPTLCPVHLSRAADFVNSMVGEFDGVG